MSEPTIRPFARHDLDWLVKRHQSLYAAEAGFDSRFGATVRAVAEDVLARADPRERGFVAEAGGRPLGSIFSTRLDAETGQIRLFLIEPGWRGSGLAPRMLAGAVDFARAEGCRRMKLWTYESHRAACALYARSGWIRGAGRPVRAYGRELVELAWVKTL